MYRVGVRVMVRGTKSRGALGSGLSTEYRIECRGEYRGEYRGESGIQD